MKKTNSIIKELEDIKIKPSSTLGNLLNEFKLIMDRNNIPAFIKTKSNPEYYLYNNYFKQLLEKYIVSYELKIASLNNRTSNEVIFKKAKKDDKSMLNTLKKLLMTKDEHGRTPLHDLGDHNVKEILKLPKYMLTIKDKYGNTPIHQVDDDGLRRNQIKKEEKHYEKWW